MIVGRSIEGEDVCPLPRFTDGHKPPLQLERGSTQPNPLPTLRGAIDIKGDKKTPGHGITTPGVELRPLSSSLGLKPPSGERGT